MGEHRARWVRLTGHEGLVGGLADEELEGGVAGLDEVVLVKDELAAKTGLGSSG